MWKFQHSVECQVGRSFAWRFWANVENMIAVDSAIESVQLNGPFAAGTTGVTKTRDQGDVEWRLVDVQDGRSATIEIPAPGAVFRCVWIFEDTACGGTRLTQQNSFEGEQAQAYAEFGKQLETNMPQGMQRLAEAMVKAASEGR